MYGLFNFVFDSGSRYSNLNYMVLRYFARRSNYKMVISVGSRYRKQMQENCNESDLYTSLILCQLSSAYLIVGKFDQIIEIQRELESLSLREDDQLKSLERQGSIAFATFLKGDAGKALSRLKAVNRRLAQYKTKSVRSVDLDSKSDNFRSAQDKIILARLRASTLLDLGIVYESFYRLENARKCYAQAHDLIAQALGLRHADLAPYKQMLAEIYWKIGCFEKALSMIQEAIVIRERYLHSDAIDLQFSYKTLADILIEQGRLKEAETLLRRVKSRFLRLDRSCGLVDLDCVYVSFARLEAKKENYDRALDYANLAIQAKAKFFSDNHILQIEPLSVKVECLKQLGQLQEARTLECRLSELKRLNKVKGINRQYHFSGAA